jgi:predicted nucleotidyltransferase component of viral defense system
MSDRYHDDLQRFREAITLAEAETGFTARLIEKDYYCSLVLQDLATQFQEGLIFKGGTCLSKVHSEFFRLSEDLDFALSIRQDVSRADRRRAATPFRHHFKDTPSRLPCFQLVEEVRGHNDSRQYTAKLAYRSVVTGEDEFIKLEISLREETVRPSEILPARTLLRNPHSGQSVIPSVDVRVLSAMEAYAEKIRAALTRPDPAIRDFFDIDHGVRLALFDHRSRPFLDVVAIKLAVDGNEPVDLSPAKIALLSRQIDTQLHSVLRPQDYETFDLARVIAILDEIVRLNNPR